MLLSKKWLSEYVKLPTGVSDKQLAERLTLSTVEVEGFVNQQEMYNHMVVGRVVSCEKHPNADRLRVCQVDVGTSQPVQIVCGGANVVADMHVAVGLPGARVKWHGQGNLIELAETEIRGEKSFGMICASVEIGLPNTPTEGDHDIRDLTELQVSAGTPLAEALGQDDVIFEIENKSLTNRPDLVGHIGMARELAALYEETFTPPEPAAVKAGKGISLTVRVEDAVACPRYMGVVLEGLEVGPSPDWLRSRLESVGVRAINNVVDATNYAMLEVGQSLHAFDADVLCSESKGVEIAVRRAHEGEVLTTLDGVERKLDPSMLTICDAAGPVVLAGIMGGKTSGVSVGTTRVFLESANFDATVVRKTSQALALRSEASMRYEKSLDPELCDLALRQTIALLANLHPNLKVISSVVDEYAGKPTKNVLTLPAGFIASRAGVEIPDNEVEAILVRLGFTVKATRAGVLTVTVPTWRSTKDISIPEDVVEEVLRIWGYERVTSSLPTFSCTPSALDPVRALSRSARQTLSLSFGASEIYSYAFVRPETLQALGWTTESHLKLANPLSDERPYLTCSLVPQVLEAVASNQRMYPTVSVFEIERIFCADQPGEEDGAGGTLPAQPYRLAIAYSQQGDEQPFGHVRSMVEEMLMRAGYMVSFENAPDGEPWLHASRRAQVSIHGHCMGYVAEVDPDVARALGVERRVAVAHVFLSELGALEHRTAAYESIPAYPDVKRDLAFVIASRVAYVDVERVLRSQSDWLKGVELFDVYEDGNVGDGKKSLAVHLTFRAPERTLSSEEVDRELKLITQSLEQELGASIRS